jgi:hypothetical protein
MDQDKLRTFSFRPVRSREVKLAVKARMTETIDDLEVRFCEKYRRTGLVFIYGRELPSR